MNFQKTLLFAATLLLPSLGAATTLVWTFNGSTDGTYSSGTPSHFTASAFSIGGSFGTVSSPISSTSSSSGYSGASGGNNIGNSYGTGTSGYYEVTFDPEANYQIKVTGFSFGTRSTATGPTAFALRSNLDSYVSDLASGSISADSAWSLKAPAVTPLLTTTPDSPVTLRLILTGGSSETTTINNRVDDISITVAAVPEPTVALLVTLGILGALHRRR